jgi:hypothetical protein
VEEILHYVIVSPAVDQSMSIENRFVYASTTKIGLLAA